MCAGQLRMLSVFNGRGRINLVVDVLFFFLVAHLVVTGQIVPGLVADFLHNPAPIAVAVEPAELINEISPTLDDIPPPADGADPA